MSLPRYPEYKDSGFPWLGKIPASWAVKRLKWAIERNDGGVWGADPDGEDDVVVLRSTEQTVDGHWKIEDPARRKLTDTEKASAILHVGDLLVTKSSGSALHIGKTTLVDEEIASRSCCYSNFMQRLRLKACLLPKLAWYVMNSELARRQFDVASNSTTGLANLNGSMISEIVLPIPSVDEQHAIATLLDRETAKIDVLIAEQEKLLALLAEKRQATISHAVTKGLNPNAPMKYSGIPWLGEVPAHWGITRLKYVTEAIVDCPHETPIYAPDGEYLVIRTADIDRGVLEPGAMYRLSRAQYQERTRRSSLQANDIVYGREGERWGHAALVPESGRFCLGQRMMQFRPSARMCPTFLMWQLNSVATYRQGELDTVGATSPHVNVSTIRNFQLTLPPLDEQREISARLGADAMRFDGLQAEAERAISLLREHRSALISATVTGKIDVRGAIGNGRAAANSTGARAATS